MFPKSKPLPIAPLTRSTSGLRRESIRRDLTMALVTEDETSAKGGFNPYDSNEGRARRDVWGARRR